VKKASKETVYDVEKGCCNIPDINKQLKLDYEASSSINIK
jgi:hypothetical protein